MNIWVTSPEPCAGVAKDFLGRSPPGRICVKLCVPARRFLGPEAPVLVLGELIQACQKRLCETCALRDGQLQGFGFQLGKVRGGLYRAARRLPRRAPPSARSCRDDGDGRR
ncbi:hypothetical protein BE20_21630 [Sorangium cellulosum]|nr:hypothetical protein BE20_21630 [Sorangium cellulosum]